MNNKKLIINSLTGTGLYFINIIVAFIMSPIMVKTLGNADYGLWEMVIGVVGYMGLLDLGVGPALLRHVAVAHGKSSQRDLQSTISTAIIFFISIGLLAMLVLLGLSFFPQILTGNTAVGTEKFGLVLLLFALNAALAFPLAAYLGILMGLQKHHLINSTRSIITVFRAAIAYYLLLNLPGKGLLILVCLEITGNVVQFILYANALRRDKEVPRFSISMCTKDKMRDLLGYGAKSAVLMAANRLQFASIPFVIGKSLGLGFIVYFVLPNRLVDYAKGFAMAIGFPLTPYFADIIGKDENDSLKSGWLTTSFALQVVTVAMPLYILFCGEKFLELWIGIEYATAGHWVLYALLLGLLAEAFSPNARQILMAKAQHGRLAIAWTIMSLCSIPLAFLGAEIYGVAGVALSSSVITVIVSAITLALTCHVMKTSLFEYLKKTLFPLTVPILLLGISLWAGGQFIRPHNYSELLLQITLGSIAYCSAIWKFSFSSELRIEFIHRIKLQVGRKGIVDSG